MIWPTVIETPRAMQAVERDDFADDPRALATQRSRLDQATDPAAIRRHAEPADLPVGEVVAVAETVVVRPDPALSAA